MKVMMLMILWLWLLRMFLMGGGGIEGMIKGNRSTCFGGRGSRR